MKKHLNIFVLFLLTSTIMLASCTSDAKSTQTTNTYPLETVTEQGTKHADQIRDTATPKELIPQTDDIGYYEGVITITQYYTLYGHGFFEEAYSLLSPSRPHSVPIDVFVENNKKLKIKDVKIITVQPLVVAVTKQGGQTRIQDAMNKRQFYVKLSVWGEEEMVGSAISGEVRTIFITLTRENGEWKIYSIDTAP